MGQVLACPWEILCLTVFLGLISWQLFVRPITGLSDNNDFSKVFGPARICKAAPENLNTYFVTGYAAGPACAFPSGFTSSEILFVDLARYLGRPFTGRYYFDLRASAALHLLVLGGAMGLFLAYTRRLGVLARVLLPLLAIVIFSDVAYAAYLNSAYMDNASWVLFLLLTSIALWACVRPRAQWIAPAYGLAGMLLVFSKAQHAVLGIPFAALAGWFAWRDRATGALLPWSVCGAALLAGSAMMPALTPPNYKNISLYNLIFYRLAPPDASVLGQLGLDADYEKWIGSQAFAVHSPLYDPDWTRAFVSRVSFSDIALFYLRHPGVALREIDHELHDSAHSIRPDYMANYRQEDGLPPHTMATRFSLWSSLRMRIANSWPYALVALYVLALLVPLRSRLFPLALTMVVAGAAEFGICTLADAIDTHRHLFLFHVITEAAILLIVGSVLSARREAAAELP